MYARLVTMDTTPMDQDVLSVIFQDVTDACQLLNVYLVCFLRSRLQMVTAMTVRIHYQIVMLPQMNTLFKLAHGPPKMNLFVQTVTKTTFGQIHRNGIAYLVDRLSIIVLDASMESVMNVKLDTI